jgi:two-component system OmpR family sensor kinase
MNRLRTHSIALPIFLLVLGAILAATAVTLAVTLGGPPPFARPIRLVSVADALKGTPANRPGERAIELATGSPPRPDTGERPNRAIDALIAAQLGTQAERVVGYYDHPRLGDNHDLRGGFTVGWRSSGGWRVVHAANDQAFARWLTITLGAMLAALLLLTAVAWWTARAISRPLRALAAAAAQAKPTMPLPTSFDGPHEVRALGEALSAMHGRLAAHVMNRTAMLAAIAHDLGTPLSRIAFWIERLPEPARTRAAADIEEMRAMIGDVLRFARDERTDVRVRVDLGSLIDALVDDLAEAGQPVVLVAGECARVSGDPVALRRLFANLIDNAVRYGSRAQIQWRVADGHAIVAIEDDGPGFDPALGERLFEPFVRGDPSRNRETGGTGLGLAIARSVAEAHGGEVTLSRASRGGGRVEVRLPLG